MTNTDPFSAFKAIQKESWGLFAPLEIITTIPAASLVKFSSLKAGNQVLDVGCGTGVAAITAARAGAHVSGIDLSPRLLERAVVNAKVAGVQIGFKEGDAEALPYSDGAFDVVLSQFGHMFAPRADIAIKEMLRVLKPGGTIAFSTWPPEMFVGRMFGLVSRFVPPPAGISPPPQWGDPSIVRERLGAAVTELTFEREIMAVPALSAGHYRESIEATLGPVIKLVESSRNEPEKLQEFRREFESLIQLYLVDNCVRQHFLMSRGKKKSV